jgi:oligopeptide transport system permease protein
MILTVLIVAVLTFFMMQWMPGSPFTNPKLTPAQIDGLNHQYGLDKPVWQQFLIYMNNLLHFNFGESFVNVGQQVSTMIAQRLPASALLGFEAMIFAVPVGIIIGTFQARRRNSKADYITSASTLLFTAIPSFILGYILQYIFGFKLHLLPYTGWDGFASTILPALSLALGIVAAIGRYSRATTIETLNSNQIELARAKGDTEKEVVRRHVYRNSITPVLTLIGPMAAALLTGSVLIENIFSIPGVGNMFVGSISSKDFPVIMASTLLYTIMLQVFILIGDILLAVADPRIRLGK